MKEHAGNGHVNKQGIRAPKLSGRAQETYHTWQQLSELRMAQPYKDKVKEGGKEDKSSDIIS